MSRKKKQTITMVVALLCLVAVGTCYVFASRYAKQKEEREAEEASADDSITLYSYDDDSVEEITFDNGKAAMTLQYKKKTWYKKGDKDFPLDQDLAESMASGVATLISDRLVMDNLDNLADYGLENPALTITIKLSSGEAVTIWLGAESTAAGGYYGYTSLEDKIYIIDDYVFERYDYTEKQLIEVEDTPSVVTDNVTHLFVESKKGDKDFEAVYDKENAVSKDIYSWDITKPFKETVAGDIYSLSQLFENFTSLSYGSCEDYTGKHDKKYGLDKPEWTIQLAYDEVIQQPTENTSEEGDASDETAEEETEEERIPHDWTLLVGDKDASGENYYVKPAGSKRIYLMEASLVEGMVDIEPMSYIYANMYIGTVYTLNSIDMEVEGESYHMELTRTEKASEEEETDEEASQGEETGTADVTFSATINGKEVDEEAFRMAYGSAGTLSYSGVIEEGVAKGDTPYCTITFHEENRDVTLTFLPYDEKSYRVDVDGTQIFITDKEAVDSFIKGFTDLLEQ